MKRAFIHIAGVVYFLISSSCELFNKKPLPSYNFSTLEINPRLDTLFLSSNNDFRTLRLSGLVVNTNARTISNTGVISSAEFTVTTIDSAYQPLNNNEASWSTSNPSVATVSAGTVTGKTPGLALITASYQKLSTRPVVVQVKLAETQPGLALDPPDFIITLQNHASVSGFVQLGAVLSVNEPNSGFSVNNLSYDGDGHYATTVTGLNPGLRAISVRATHPTRSDLFTERYKFVYYLTFGSGSADSLTGLWKGTTYGHDFYFTVSKNSLLNRYDIGGTIDIQFAGYGLVRDVQLTGLVNGDGTIDQQVSGTVEGFSISGSMTGYFKSLGKGAGTIAAKATRSGWPDLGFRADWTAVKVQ
jgi:hypothetical protein